MAIRASDGGTAAVSVRQRLEMVDLVARRRADLTQRLDPGMSQALTGDRLCGVRLCRQPVPRRLVHCECLGLWSAVERARTAKVSSSASRMPSVMPCVVIGSLK